MNRYPIARRRRKTTNTETLETRALLSTITVNTTENTANDGLVSLQEAIEAANTDTSVDGSVAGDGADTIVFDASLDDQTINTGDTVPITESVTIMGNGSGNTTIRNRRSQTLFIVPQDTSGVHVVLEDLRITRSRFGIDHLTTDGSVTVRRSRMRHNRHAIRSRSDVTVRNTEFFENKSSLAGAAIQTWDPNDSEVSLDIARSRFIGNSTDGTDAAGGAVYSFNGSARVTSSLFVGNSTNRSRSNGGALFLGDSDIFIANSTFTENISEQSGGAMYLWRSDSTIVNSTIVGNRTMFDDHASGFSGGIRFAGNSTSPNTLHLVNSVVANNTQGDTDLEEDLHVSDGQVIASHSLLGTNLHSELEDSGGVADENGNFIGSEETPIEPELGPLQDNGGPTHTMFPLPGSPLLDAGSVTTLRTDQRGQPRVGGSQVDMGAAEAADLGFRVSASDTVVNESDDTLTIMFDVTLLQDLDNSVDVTLTTTDISTEAGSDYTTNGTAITFDGTAGETKQFEVTIVDDSNLELRESFQVGFAADLTGQIAAFTPTIVRIDSDDDTGVGLSGSTLLVFGTGADDTATVESAGDDVVVTLNGSAQSFDASMIESATIRMRDGDNSLTIDETLDFVADVTSGEGNDTITTAAGDDTVRTGGGNDLIDTGAGNDYAFGGTGSDSLSGGAGKDTLIGALGNDSVSGGNANDLLMGHQGHDTLVGGDGADTLLGGGSSDSLVGGAGADRLFGFTDSAIDDTGGNDRGDRIEGGEDNDQIDAGLGFNRVDGGLGNDTASTAGGGVLRGGEGDDSLRATGSDPVRILGEDGRDTLVGGSGNDTLLGNKGRDSIHGTDGDDVLVGGLERDTLVGGNQNDDLDGGKGGDLVIGGNGDDTINGNDGPDRLDGGSDNDLLLGGVGNDRLQGGSGHDILLGEAGIDVLTGSLGNDIVVGGAGTDNLAGQDDTDIMIGGTTNLTTADLFLAHAEWISEREVTVRRDNLVDGSGSTERENADSFLIRAEGASQTVFDDNEADTVTGGDGIDWVFVNFDQDESDSDIF